jgi:hypothetical protein
MRADLSRFVIFCKKGGEILFDFGRSKLTLEKSQLRSTLRLMPALIGCRLMQLRLSLMSF